MTDARQELIAYLRWLADQPDGLRHRSMLYRAAYMLTHGASEPIPHERHGDQTT